MKVYELYERLFELIKNNEVKEFKKMTGGNIDNPEFNINTRDNHNNYFINYAVALNNIELINYLLETGSKIDVVDNEEKSILYNPIKYGFDNILELLLRFDASTIGISILDQPDKDGYIPLHYAIKFSNINAIKLLLKYGSNPNIHDKNGSTSLHLSIFSRSFEIFEIILNSVGNVNHRRKNGENALHLACNFQLINFVKKLLEHNIDVNTQDYTHEFSPLHYSVNLKNTDIVKMLLEKKNINPNVQDIVGNTSLHYILIEGRTDLFDIFLNYDSDKKVLNYNLWNMDMDIPLHNALYNIINVSSDELNKFDESYNDKIVSALLPKSNVNIKNKYGDTCLHLLCRLNYWKKYKDVLITKRLDIFSANLNGVAPIDLIDLNDYDEFVQIVVKSYYNRLKKAGKLWMNEWENICAKNFDVMTDDDYVKLGLDKKSKKLEDVENECENIIERQIRNNINLYKRGSLTREQELTKDVKNTEKIISSFPVKSVDKYINLNKGEFVSFSTFTGSSLDILIGLIFLLNKHNNACSILTESFVEKESLCKFYRSIGILINSKCEFFNFEIIWAYNKLYLADNFFNNFKKCLKKQIEFIIIPIGITMQNGNHANYIIYDVASKEVERFEPHGSSPPAKLQYNPDLLDDILHNRFREIDSEIKYFSPKHYLPKIGFQILELYEKKHSRIGDPAGFCAIWAIWYTDMRLTYKDINRKKLVKELLFKLRDKNIQFKELIRNYSHQIVKIRDGILSSGNMDINDWDNEQYTDVQIDKIMKNLSLLINKL